MSDFQDSIGQRYARHGYSRKNNGIYLSWAAMIQRCKNPNNPDYKNYGARGIEVCDRWLIAANFISDMSPRPRNWTLERINNDGNYEPHNCKWIPKGEQNKNKRKSLRKPLTIEHKASISAGLKLLYSTGWMKRRRPLTAERKTKIAKSMRLFRQRQAASSSSSVDEI